MSDPSAGGTDDAMLEPLAEQAIEVLVTHNEAVSCDDLACALRVSNAAAWEIAIKLRNIGYAVLDDENAMITATPQANSMDSL
jgi:biotin operon repressor